MICDLGGKFQVVLPVDCPHQITFGSIQMSRKVHFFFDQTETVWKSKTRLAFTCYLEKCILGFVQCHKCTSVLSSPFKVPLSGSSSRKPDSALRCFRDLMGSSNVTVVSSSNSEKKIEYPI